MPKKPTYEELKQRVKELEKEALARERAVETLLESEEQLGAMLGSIGDHMSMMDKDLNIIWANETARKIFGNEIIGKKCYEVYHGRKEPCEPYPCLTLQAFEDGKVHEHDTQVIGQDGKEIYFHCTTNISLKNDEGNPTAVIEISRDITEQKQAEKALRESEGRFRTIFENSPIGIDIVDKEGRPLYVNIALQEMLGYSEDELRSMAFTEYTHPDDVEDSLKLVRSLLDGKSDYLDMEKRYYQKDGKLIWAHTTISAVRDADGEFQYFIAMVQETTERKRSEEALKEKDRELRQQARHLEEVNTALKVLIQHRNEEREKLEESILMNLRKLVLPYMEKMDKDRIGAENRTYLSIIKSNLENLVSPFANRLSSKAMNLTPTEIQIADLVKQGQTSKEIASMLSVSPNAVMFHRKNIRKKLGLANKKTNLRSHLQSLSI
ncbi:MAG: PAS domain S-box protein [Deltaproteobacteria bacterium]|nr:PAS domain S-box protein [Deltaproteobacteria bacterium]MBW2345271.1 PAS domain S-box protein [Deltaproteobacteria bacterium]